MRSKLGWSVCAVTAALVLCLTERVGAELGDERVNQVTTGFQGGISVAGTVGGMAVWTAEGQDGDGLAVVGRRLASGSPVGSEFQVNSWTTSDQYEPAVAAESDGTYLVVWTSYGQDGDRGGIFAQRFDGTGNRIGSEFRLNAFAGNYQGRPDVAFLQGKDGTFVAVWEGYEPIVSHGTHIHGRVFDLDGRALGEEFEVEGAFDGADQGLPAATPLPDGGFAVVWTDQEFLDAVQIQRFDDTGSPMGSAFQVNHRSAGAVSLDACTLPGGKFVVVWSGEHFESEPQYGFVDAAWGRLFDFTGTPIGDEFRLDESSFRQRGVGVACNQREEFLAAWSAADERPFRRIVAQSYDERGQPRGHMFELAPPTAGGQGAPNVAALLDGSFIVGWNSVSGDPPNVDVFARRVTDTARVCTGDCNRDGCVTIDEVVKGVGFLLGDAQSQGCDGYQGDRQGAVTVDQLVMAVGNALEGCH